MMSLSDRDRDELLVDIFEGIAGLASQFEHHSKIKNLRERVAYYKNKLSNEDEIKTRVGNGMYDIGDYVIINVGNNIYKGKIIGTINYDNHPGYKVQSLINDSDVWVVKEKDVSRRIRSSLLPPPPPINATIPKIPAVDKLPTVNGDEIEMVSISGPAKKKSSMPPPPPKRSSLPPPLPKRSTLPTPPPKPQSSFPPPPTIDIKGISEMKRESALWAKEAKQKVDAIQDVGPRDLEIIVK